jgi:hypothetical protein
LGKGLKKSAQAEAKARRRVLTIIECSLQFEVTPFPTRAAVQALRANTNSSCSSAANEWLFLSVWLESRTQERDMQPRVGWGYQLTLIYESVSANGRGLSCERVS